MDDPLTASTDAAIASAAEWLARARRVVVLTGAGISVASGLRPYRGPGGLWEEKPELADELRAGVPVARLWETLGSWRAEVRAARPNAAHEALTRLEHSVASRGGAFVLITQNVDALHTRAGTANVVELHGRLCRTRCTACDAPAFGDEVAHPVPPACKRCGSPLRPDVVLFDEPLGAEEEVSAKRAFRGAEVFVAIGTSGTVWPAAAFVRWARFEGARTVLVDLTAPGGSDWDLRLSGRAEALVPALVDRALAS